MKKASTSPAKRVMLKGSMMPSKMTSKKFMPFKPKVKSVPKNYKNYDMAQAQSTNNANGRAKFG